MPLEIQHEVSGITGLSLLFYNNPLFSMASPKWCCQVGHTYFPLSNNTAIITAVLVTSSTPPWPEQHHNFCGVNTKQQFCPLTTQIPKAASASSVLAELYGHQDMHSIRCDICSFILNESVLAQAEEIQKGSLQVEINIKIEQDEKPVGFSSACLATAKGCGCGLAVDDYFPVSCMRL